MAPSGTRTVSPVDRDVDQPPRGVEEHAAHTGSFPFPFALAAPIRPSFTAEAAALTAVWPRPQIDASRATVPMSSSSASSRSAEPSGAPRASRPSSSSWRTVPDPAGNALAAGLVPEEPGDPLQQAGQVHGVVEHQDDPGPQRRADGADPLERQRGVQRVRRDERARRAAEQHRLQRPPAAHSARRLDHLAQGDPEVVLVQAGSGDAAGQAEQPGAGGALGADSREGRPSDAQDFRHAEQRLHVVDGRRLAEQAGLRGERRLVPRLRPLALDRVAQGRLLAGDVRAGSPPDLDVEGEALAHDVRTEEPPGTGLLDGVPQPRLGQRVLTPDVEVALLRTAGIAHDRDGFQQGERVFLHQHPVFEGARLGFVGVADDVVRPDRVGGHRLPLHRGRERRPAPAEQLGVLQFPDHALRAQRHRPAQHLVPARRPVGVERARVEPPHPAQQPERGAVAVGLRDERAGDRGGPGGERAGRTWSGVERGQHRTGGLRACLLDHRRRAAVALAQAGAALPGDRRYRWTAPALGALGPEPALHLLAHLLRAVDPAGQVVADVDDRGGDGLVRNRA